MLLPVSAKALRIVLISVASFYPGRSDLFYILTIMAFSRQETLENIFSRTWMWLHVSDSYSSMSIVYRLSGDAWVERMPGWSSPLYVRCYGGPGRNDSTKARETGTGDSPSATARPYPHGRLAGRPCGWMAKVHDSALAPVSQLVVCTTTLYDLMKTD